VKKSVYLAYYLPEIKYKPKPTITAIITRLLNIGIAIIPKKPKSQIRRAMTTTDLSAPGRASISQMIRRKISTSQRFTLNRLKVKSGILRAAKGP